METEALWWPPGKIVGQYLGPFLADWAGIVLPSPEGVDAVAVEVDLSSALTGWLEARRERL